MNKGELNKRIQKMESNVAFLRTERDAMKKRLGERDRQIVKLNKVVAFIRRSWWNRLRLRLRAWRRK